VRLAHPETSPSLLRLFHAIDPRPFRWPSVGCEARSGMLLAQAADSAMQTVVFTLALVAMVFAGVGKRRLEWRPPRKPHRRGWFRRGGPAGASRR